MSELERVVLGTVFTVEYKTMVTACERTGTSLFDQEVRIFPLRHTDVAARLLTLWQVPAAVIQPLKQLADGYFRVEQLREPLRTKTELIKIAVLLGNLAAGGWEPWQLLEIPPVPVLARLNLGGIDELLVELKRELQDAIASLKGQKPIKKRLGSNCRSATQHRLAYYCIGTPRFDFLGAVLGSIADEAMHYSAEDLNTVDSVVINCLGVPPSRLCDYLANSSVARDAQFSPTRSARANTHR